MGSRLLGLLATVLTAAAAGRAETVFLAGFDAGYDADFAQGSPKARLAEGVTDEDVRLTEGRFGRGVFIGRKVPALALSYPSKGNFPVKEGTVEFWFRPEWSSDFREPDGPAWLQGRTEVVFFLTSGEPTGFRLVKNQYNVLHFFYALSYDSAKSRVGRVGNLWTKGRWNYYAVSWDEKEARLFLDGRLLGVSDRWEVAGLIGDRLALGSLAGGPTRRDGAWGTFDDFRISDRKLHVSSFAPPEGPLTAEKAAPLPPASAAATSSPVAPETDKVLFLADFANGLPATYATGSRLALTNRALGTEDVAGVKAARLHRPPGGVGDTLGYETAKNLDPFLGTAEVTVRFDNASALPAAILDATDVAVNPKRPLVTTTRTGMRLVVTKEGGLAWEALAAGDVVGSLKTEPLGLKAGEWHRLGFSWRGSKISLLRDGKILASREGLAVPAELPRYFFVGSDVQAQDTLDGWVKDIRIVQR